MNRTNLYKLVQNGRGNPDLIAIEIYKRVLQRKCRKARSRSITTSYDEISAQFCNYYGQSTIVGKMKKLQKLGLVKYSIIVKKEGSILEVELPKEKRFEEVV